MSEKTQNYGIDQGIGTNRVIDWARDGRELWYEFISFGYQTMPVAFSAAPCDA